MNQLDNPASPVKRCLGCKEYKSKDLFYLYYNSGTASYKSYCIPCDKKITLKNQNKRYKFLRFEIINHYSNRTNSCACCGENRAEFLTVDHLEKPINRRMGYDSGSSFYRRLIRLKFPKGYQILCMNCNHSKGIRGYCPHEIERKRPMRKNSAQIYKEVLLDHELSQLPAETRLMLDTAIDDLTNFHLNELEALAKLIEIRVDSPSHVSSYISQVIIDHSRTLLAILGLTGEGFKIAIDDLEKKRDAYYRMRGKANDKIGNAI